MSTQSERDEQDVRFRQSDDAYQKYARKLRDDGRDRKMLARPSENQRHPYQGTTGDNAIQRSPM